MHALWTIERGFLKDIMEAYPEPKPHHNTVATVLKILVEKGFLKVKPFGRLHRYEVKVSKEQYYQQLLRLFIEEYYNASPELLLAEMVRLELLNDQHLKRYTTGAIAESASVKEEETKKQNLRKKRKRRKRNLKEKTEKKSVE